MGTMIMIIGTIKNIIRNFKFIRSVEIING